MRNGAGPSRPAGLSILEVVLAAVLLIAVAIPVVNALYGLRAGLSRTTRRGTALFLGQAVLEDTLYRLYSEAPHVDTSGAATSEQLASLQQFFRGLGEKGARVATETEAGRSQYFARVENLRGLGLHGITPTLYPDLYRHLEDYTCEIEATCPAAAPYAGATPEQELCEIKVTMLWTEGGRRHDRQLTLFTLLTSRREGNVP